MNILGRLRPGEDSVAANLCEVSAQVCGTTGAGIVLMVDERYAGTLCSTDETSLLIEEIEFTVGEGPCLDTFRQATPVLAPDLAGPHHSRWSAFTPQALEAGAEALFAFPLGIGELRLGAVSLYRTSPGALSSDEYENALVVASVASHSVLGMQQGAPAGSLAGELNQSIEHRFVVHQASGMLSARYDITVNEALVRLRAWAFARGRLITEVAKEVVEGGLDPEGFERFPE